MARLGRAGIGRAGLVGLLVLAAAGLAVVAGEEGAASTPVVVTYDEDGNIKRSNDMSTPAFVICFRESVEGTVIVAVLLNMLFKANLPHMKKWVWVGAFIGTGAFALLGVIAIIVWYQIKKTVPTAHRAAFEGVFAALACFILTLMAFKFLRLKDIMFKWENKLFKDSGAEADDAKQPADDAKQPAAEEKKAATCSCLEGLREMMHIKHQAISRDDDGVSPRMLIILTFSAIFREGVETVVFLLPMTTTHTEAGVFKGAAGGLAAGIAFGIFVLVVGKYMLRDIMWFFNLTTAFILFIAAGLSTYSMIEFEQVDRGALPRNDPIIMRPMYNIGCVKRHPQVETLCFLEEGTGAGLVFRSLLGYRATPTMLMCVAYLFYWQVIIVLMVLRYKKGTLFSRTPPGSSPPVTQAVALEQGQAGTGVGVGAMAPPMPLINIPSGYPAPFPGYHPPQGMQYYGAPPMPMSGTGFPMGGAPMGMPMQPMPGMMAPGNFQYGSA